MGYLIFQILFFLLVAALLGFAIGWLLRGTRFQGELQDLDGRWRSKLKEVETDRDRFASEVNQANEARARSEASAAEAKQTVETQEASLQQLRREHQTNLAAMADMEKRVGGLEGDVASRDKELAEMRSTLADSGGQSGEIEQLRQEHAAASRRAEELEGDLRKAKEANGACRQEVERLEARLADVQREGSGGALASTGPQDEVAAKGADENDQPSASEEEASSGDAGALPGGGALGLVGGTDVTASTAQEDDKKDAPAVDEDSEGERPEGLAEPEGGSADNLKKISGVGPKLEKTLNGLGIFHFAQIAAFTPENVAWVNRHLRFRGRIQRENWIEQAKTLASGGETEFSRRS